MAKVTRKIGLSLGADICWPICYEDIVRELDLSIPVGEDLVRFEVTRVTIEPFSLTKPRSYDLVIDRLTHWYDTSREWIKKSILLDDVYVFNNPWSVQSMEKQTSYCAMMRLGMPIPDTVLVPPKEYEPVADLKETLEQYAKMFDLGQLGRELGFPIFMKPYDGGCWKGVTKIDDEQQLLDAYDQSGKLVMHLQKGVLPYECFVRCVGLGPQVKAVKYDPSAPLHGRYVNEFEFLGADDLALLEDITLTINSFFGWDFNSCESLLKDGVWHPIDFANPCPDSQVTSLHCHFPWLIKAKVRWSLFCAATNRPMRKTLSWQEYFDIADQDLPYREKLRAYGDLARERFDAERFEDFCAQHLSRLDEIAWEYFGGEAARAAVRKKVEAVFPDYEWDEFTEHFWSEIQRWRDHESSESAARQERP